MDDKGEKCKEVRDILVNNKLHTAEGENDTDEASCSADNNSTSKSLNSSFHDDLSDDENICRSPQKSPVKKIQPARVESALPSDEDFQFKKPKFRKKKFIFHPFVRNSEGVCVPDQDREPVEVTIPEQLAASYGLYIWPSAPVLAWYIWLNQVILFYLKIL